MSRFSLLSLGLTALVAFVGLSTDAKPNQAGRDRGPVPEPGVQKTLKGPTETTAQIVKNVIRILTEQHITKRSLDDETAQRWFKLFLKEIDSGKVFLTQQDVDQFQARVKDLPERLRQGDITLTYDMFKKVVERADQRLKMAEELLEKVLPLTGNEEHVVDPIKAAFAKSEEEAQERWRRRLKYETLLHLADKATPAEAKVRVQKRLQTQRQSYHNYDDEQLLELTLGAVAGAFDPLSRYIAPRSWGEFVEQSRGQFDGIGVQISADKGMAEILRIIPGGPAHKDGRLKAGDKIVGIDPTGGDKFIDVIGKPVGDSVKLIRGKSGDKVKLEIIPAGQANRSLITLERGPVPTARAHGVMLEAGKKADGSPFKVGYLFLPGFYGGVAGIQSQASSADVRRILAEGDKSFKALGADLVLFDLRTNSGGVLNEMINMAEFFIPSGVIYMVKDRDGKVQSVTGEAKAAVYDAPVVVFDKPSHKLAAEMFAAALQSHGRALVVGEPTVGLGTIQSLATVDGGKDLATTKLGVVRITRNQFYRPDGESTQKRGVVPDVNLPWMTLPATGESSKEFALESDRVDSAKFTRFPFGIDEKLRAKLGELSTQRRADSKEFKDLMKLIDLQNQEHKSGSVVLNLKKYLDEQAARGVLPADAIRFRKVDETESAERDFYLEEVLAICRDFYATAGAKK